jgi:hypothetical protein
MGGTSRSLRKCQMGLVDGHGRVMEDLLTPGSVPKTCMMYMPHLVHFMLSVGSKASASIPVKAGMSENIARATDIG